jgi:hypothetical protein
VISDDSLQVKVNGINSFGYYWSATITTDNNNLKVSVCPVTLFGYTGVNFTFLQKDKLMTNMLFELSIIFSEEGFIYDSYELSTQFIDANYWLNYYNVRYAVIDEHEFRASRFLELTNNWEIIQRIDRFLILRRKVN